MILLVEDDRIVAAALTRALVDAGHVVRGAARAGDALRIVADDPLPLDELDAEAVASLARDGLVQIESGLVSLPGS